MSVHVRYAARRPRHPECFFARYAIMDSIGEMPPCDGRLVRCHLISQHALKRTPEYKALESDLAQRHFLLDPSTWVWGCGGPMGLSGHHGMFDFSKRIRVPRCHVPAVTEMLAYDLGLMWYLDRNYGARSCIAR